MNQAFKYMFVFFFGLSQLSLGQMLPVPGSIRLNSWEISVSEFVPGEAITIRYQICNFGVLSADIGLGASIRPLTSTYGEITDPGGDILVTVEPGCNWYERTFLLTNDLELGSYSLALGVWSGQPGSGTWLGGTGWIGNVFDIVQSHTSLNGWDISDVEFMPGETITIGYRLCNSSLFPEDIGLGASIRPSSALSGEITDSAGDVIVSVEPGCHWYERTFLVPDDVETGPYSLALGIWQGIPGTGTWLEGTGWMQNRFDVELETVYSVPLDSSPGWMIEGGWAFGPPLGQGGSSYGNADPAEGATGTNVYGVNLAGDYSTSLLGESYLTAAPFDCSLVERTVLHFERWLNTDYQPYVSASIEISLDRINWTVVWENENSPITDESWTAVEYDISTVADRASEVYIRWGYSVGPNAYAYSGWNIDDISILGVPVQLLPPLETSPTDNLALGVDVSQSDNGWGGGAAKSDITDGIRTYEHWANGLAFTGGESEWAGEPCGWRQATLDFGVPTTFDQVLVWHHGRENHAPNTYEIQYWDDVTSTWVDVFSTTLGRNYLVYPAGDGSNWWENWSSPTENIFAPVTSSKVRVALENCDLVHGWIYEIEVYGPVQ